MIVEDYSIINTYKYFDFSCHFYIPPIAN